MTAALTLQAKTLDFSQFWVARQLPIDTTKDFTGNQWFFKWFFWNVNRLHERCCYLVFFKTYCLKWTIFESSLHRTIAMLIASRSVISSQSSFYFDNESCLLDKRRCFTTKGKVFLDSMNHRSPPFSSST